MKGRKVIGELNVRMIREVYGTTNDLLTGAMACKMTRNQMIHWQTVIIEEEKDLATCLSHAPVPLIRGVSRMSHGNESHMSILPHQPWLIAADDQDFHQFTISQLEPEPISDHADQC